ncbi:non-ribosomal peptide synthetase [Actinoplanes derwentensis]|uniref:Amino acid adenylation domain-containing protein n=1 Tax=Actinoplanes derwentensis TaxID=113562 RepID=A0A1H2DCT0_9ACTN|nr:non-ribosomal peptide synthetase [Actinoplanes derwentensis]GID89556.1 hypothetical protein Ade03nite_84800 [Actinoplanes derwentensis]SDT80511.1 amino acid adenylation domain-containing protein [Actinoplanes derwentensis]
MTVTDGAEAPATPGQEELWLFEQAQPGTATYHLPEFWVLRGDLDREALAAAVDDLVARHPALRTRLHTIDGAGLRQVVSAPPVSVLQQYDLNDPQTPAEAELIERLVHSPTRLDRELPIRAVLIRRHSQEHVFGIVVHHVAADGWSFAVLRRDLGRAYRSRATGCPPDLGSSRVSYLDFASRQHADGTRVEASGTWTAADPPRLPLLPASGTRTEGALLEIPVDDESLARLSDWAMDRGTTLFVVLLAVFGWVTGRWTNQSRFLVTTPLSIRDDPALDETVGYFVRTAAMVVDTADTTDLGVVAGRLHDEMLRALDRDPGRAPRLTDHVSFSVESGPSPTINLGELTVDPLHEHTGTSKFAFAVRIERRPGNSAILAEYEPSRFGTLGVRRFLDHFREVLRVAAVEPATRWPDVPAADAELIATVSSGKRRDGTADTVGRIADAVRRWPGALAATTLAGTNLEYAHLWSRAGDTARVLMRAGVEPGALVATCLPIGPEFLVAIVGIMRAGAAFVALDPHDPPVRRAEMLRSAGVSLLVAGREVGTTDDWAGRRIEPPDVADGPLAGQHAERSGPLPGDSFHPLGIAYVTFTSGSTGAPKGVVSTHQGLANYLDWAVTAYGLAPGQTVPLHTPVAYDLAITSMLAPLVVGATIHTVPDTPRRHADVARRFGDYHLVKTTPTHVSILQSQATAGRGPAVLVLGGEQLSLSQVASLRQAFPATRVVNEYGPTETVVGSTAYSWDGPAPAGQAEGAAPIGLPIDNTVVTVLDVELRPVPVGVWGQLAIGGRGVSHGYLGAPGRTADRFRPDPYSGVAGARMYLTGDIVRWTEAGELELSGRLDDQVKIFGHRVEPGEIEAVLMAGAGVRQAAVVVGAGEPRRIRAFVAGGESAQLWAHLRQRLPQRLLPASITVLEHLPMTSNGKVDRGELLSFPVPSSGPGIPEPDESPLRTAAGASEWESWIARAWEEELGCSPVSANDDYFAIGGDSLAAVRICRRISARAGRDIRVNDLFAHPTPARLAAHVAASGQEPMARLRRVQRTRIADIVRKTDQC